MTPKATETITIDHNTTVVKIVTTEPLSEEMITEALEEKGIYVSSIEVVERY